VAQTALAMLHWKSRWDTFSSRAQKYHFGSPDHFLLIMLSFVRIALLITSQRNILILLGILLFQIFLW
jgi:hypothetical protein